MTTRKGGLFTVYRNTPRNQCCSDAAIYAYTLSIYSKVSSSLCLTRNWRVCTMYYAAAEHLICMYLPHLDPTIRINHRFINQAVDRVALVHGLLWRDWYEWLVTGPTGTRCACHCHCATPPVCPPVAQLSKNSVPHWNFTSTCNRGNSCISGYKVVTVLMV